MSEIWLSSKPFCNHAATLCGVSMAFDPSSKDPKGFPLSWMAPLAITVKPSGPAVNCCMWAVSNLAGSKTGSPFLNLMPLKYSDVLIVPGF